MHEKDKIRIITRDDISIGYQAVQAIHAAIEFCFEHSELACAWHETSNHIALLVVSNEEKLIKLAEKAKKNGVRVSLFAEPDIGNQITAIAMEPCPEAKKICKKLRLMNGKTNGERNNIY